MRQKFVILASIFSLAFGVAPDAMCQWVRTGSYNNIFCLTASGTNLFAGTYGEGVFRSSDNGASWSALNTGFVHSITALVASGTNLFAGTPEGVFRSSDNGTNWEETSAGLTIKNIYALTVIGTDLLASTNGGGIFRSSDNGTNWTQASTRFIGNKIYIYSFLTSGTDLFAGTSDSGVYRSTDNGTTWTPPNKSDLSYDAAKGLGMIGTNLVAGSNGYGIFISTDNGINWTLASSGLESKKVDIYGFAPSGKNIFAAAGDAGVYLSSDNGASWSAVNTGLPDQRFNSLAIVGAYIFTGSTDSGVYRRPLSDFGPSSVSQSSLSSNTITSFPNPFNGRATIRFSSKESGQAQVIIMNLLGSEVARLFSGELDGGEHSFTWDARGMPAGMYVAVVKSGGEEREIPIVLMK